MKTAVLGFLIFSTPLAYADSSIHCDTVFGATLNRELNDFFHRPKKGKAAVELGHRVCLTAPNGQNPCPVNVGGERAGQLSNAARKIGAAVVPIAVCLSEHANGAIKEDMHEMLSDLVDRIGPGFFKTYYSMPKPDLQGAAPFSGYLGVVPDSAENYSKRVRVLQKRLNMVKKLVIPTVNEEFHNDATPIIAEALREAQAYLTEAETSGGNAGQFYFPPSKFDEEVVSRLTRFKIEEPTGMAEVAEKIRRDLGLSYIIELRPGPKIIWSLCRSAEPVSCKNAPVSVVINTGPCQMKAAAVTVRKSTTNTWWVMNQNNQVYQIHPKQNFISAGVAVELRNKLGKTVRRWVAPNYSFKLHALSRDLTKVYFSKTVKSAINSKLGEIFLEIAEDGGAHFVTMKKDSAIESSQPDPSIFLKALEGEQPVPDMGAASGQGYRIDVAKPCR